MAKNNSFDIVSELNMQEVENACNNTAKALHQRYDLKDSASNISFDKKSACINILAPNDFVQKQIIDILNTQLIRRKVELKALVWGSAQESSKGMQRITATLVQGIDSETCKKICKDIKAQKYKVTVQIEGNKLRISASKRDTLQEVIAFVKKQDYGLPLQCNNYR